MRLSFFLTFIVLFGFGSDELQSQITVSGSLLNIENNSAVAYATIGVEGRPYGTHSNIDGTFVLEELKPKDVIQIRHINYHVFSFCIDTLTECTEIRLTPRSYNLEAIVITPKKHKIKQIGYTRGRSVYSSRAGGEFTMLIKNKKYLEAHISKIVFEIKRRTTHRNAIKIHLYENNNEQPGSEINLKNNIIIIDKTIENKIIYEPSEKIIFPKEGLFIGYEWLGHIDNKGNLLRNAKSSLNDYTGPGIKCRRNKSPSIIYRSWNSNWRVVGSGYRACISVLLVQNK